MSRPYWWQSLGRLFQSMANGIPMHMNAGEFMRRFNSDDYFVPDIFNPPFGGIGPRARLLHVEHKQGVKYGRDS